MWLLLAAAEAKGINVFTTWIRGNRCGDGHYIITIIIIYIKGLAKILWLQTNASLARARAIGFCEDHSTRDPIISRCVCILVSCGYIRTIIILYILLWRCHRRECSHLVTPQCCMCVRTKVFADNPIKFRPCKVYINILYNAYTPSV